ncbi:MAG: hypothetical protein PF487_01405 [Bacteroidales bacterium]|jgi:hypothetical protein|nr:hypothetical protein [Bacteroidales bacterium]
MKMIYISCNVSVREPLLKKLENNNVKDYQVIEKITAKSMKGDPRFDNAVWPGYNSAIFIQASDDERTKEIIALLKDFNDKAFNDNELITVASWTLDDYFFD